MKLITMYTIAIALLVACTGRTSTDSSIQSDSSNSGDSTHIQAGNVVVLDTTRYRELLQGIWGESDKLNAAFEIKGDSLFYFEDPSPVFYDVKQDSFRVFIDGKKYSSKIIKLSLDSFYRIEYTELIKLHKLTPRHP